MPFSGKVYYYDGKTPVQLGDEIQTRVLIFFKETGRVAYLPGTSPYNHHFHEDGIPEVVMECDHGARVALVVDPEMFRLEKNVKFIRRNTENIPSVGVNENPFSDA